MDAKSTAAPLRLPAFDPWLTATGPKLRALVDWTVSGLLATAPKRLRARRPADAATFAATVEAIVCNLVRCYLLGIPAFRVTRSKRTLARRSRYLSPLLAKQLPVILDLFNEKMGATDMTLGARNPFGLSTQTTVSANDWYVARITERDITLSDISRREGEELVLLKAPKSADGSAALEEYDDTETTNEYRAEVRLINAHLRAADIRYLGERRVDDGDRHLVRRFTRSSFGSGGRLWGSHFWRPLEADDRLNNILINSEHVVAIDFKAMGVALAYAYLRLPLPATDAYTFGAPLGLSRDACKVLMSACLFNEGELTQWPRVLQGTTDGVKVATAIEALKSAHPALVPLLFVGLGHAFQFTESEVLVDALLRLVKQGVTALSVHDGIYVATSDVGVATAALLESFHFHTGQHGAVAVETKDIQHDHQIQG